MNIILIGEPVGIGAALLARLVARGDRVLVAGSHGQPAVAGEGVLTSRHDLAAPEAAQAIVAEAVRAFGGIDSVVVTAALMRSGPLAQWSVADWEASAAINLRLPFLVAQAAAPFLARSANASIVFLSSTAALRGSAGAAPFQMAKAALPALARSLTAELGPLGIRVNCVLPGWIETAFSQAFWATQPDPAAARAAVEAAIPLGRQGDADEVAGTIAFLISADGRYVAGTAIVVDGGYTAT